MPTGRQVNFTHDALGRQVSVKNGSANLATNISYHPSGSTAGLSYGNGQLYTQTLNALLQPTHVTSTKNGTAVFDRWYTYNNRGLVSAITDSTNTTYNQSFSYDGLGQLTTASGKWGFGQF